MKTSLLLIFLVAGSLLTANAQMADTLVTFESTADTTGWVVFANGDNPSADDVMVVVNPDTTGINPTDSVLMFNVNADAQVFAGMVLNDYFVGDSAIAITEENHIFTMQVYKTNLSNVGLKLEQEIGGGPVYEVLVPNTVINEWEVITFDFSEVIGSTFEALVIFPDFPEMRMEGTVVYIDNIIFGDPEATSSPLLEKAALKVYPNPAHDLLYVQHPGMTGYTISNSLGQSVEARQFGTTDQRTIDVARLKTGIHFLTVQSKSGVHTTRFIKK
jgi:hypothetical protein